LLKKHSRQICARTQGQQERRARGTSRAGAQGSALRTGPDPRARCAQGAAPCAQEHRGARCSQGRIRERAAHRNGHRTSHREGWIRDRAGQGDRIRGVSRVGSRGEAGSASVVGSATEQRQGQPDPRLRRLDEDGGRIRDEAEAGAAGSATAQRQGNRIHDCDG
jgi:hypothetical protein